VEINLPGRSVLAKLDLVTFKFLEVVTLTTDVVYLSWGTCSEAQGG
jgi:hypothetical protein